MKLFKGKIGWYTFFIFLSVLAAAGNMGVILLFNDIIQNIITGAAGVGSNHLYFFIGSLLLFFVCRFFVSLGIISLTQDLLGQSRLEIMDIVLRSSFFPLMRNKDRVYTAMTRDVGNVVQASISLVDIVTNAIVILIAFIYLGLLNWQLLLCIVGLIAGTLLIYVASERRGRKLLNEAMTWEDRFIKYLSEMLSGFKEVIIDRKKGQAIQAIHIEKAISKVIKLNKRAFVIFLNNRIIGQLAFYVFIGLVLLYLGNFFSVQSEILVSFVFTVLYVFGPIETIILLIPGLSQALSSIDRLTTLRNDLTEEQPEKERIEYYSHFRDLELKGLRYQYRNEGYDDTPFTVGPIQFQISKGEIIFISGGNGSGKTTFINLLTGLHRFDEGQVWVNGQAVAKTNAFQYRALFAPVFSDFHLFDRCYGLDEVNNELLDEYLALFELSSKVSFREGTFSSINLSAGQRKRLALICTLLEQKPIIILDEFAADQDPEFRRKFYREILPFMQERGFTVIAVTHDDYYYHCCDVRYHMKDGMLEEVEVPTVPAITA